MDFTVLAKGIALAGCAIGAVLALEAVWTVSDIFNGLMAFPNLLALLLLSNFVKKHKHF